MIAPLFIRRFALAAPPLRAGRRIIPRLLGWAVCGCLLGGYAAAAWAQSSGASNSNSADPNGGGFNPFQQPPSNYDLKLMPLPNQPSLPPYQQRPSQQSMLPTPALLPPSSLQSDTPSAPQKPPAPPSQLVKGVPSPAASYGKQSTTDDNSTDNAPDCTSTEGKRLGFFQRRGEETPPPENEIPSQFQPDHYPRFLGFGDPLTGTSWQNRPWHVDFFTGSMIGDDAVDHVLGQEAGFWAGLRLGWDYDYYWGVESRAGYSWMSLFDSKNPNHKIGDGNIIDWDMHLLYYPWGDSRWRPFVLVGMGISQFDSLGAQPKIYNATLVEVPFGLGMKYHLNEWLAFRFDVTDNYVFGDGSLDNMNNISFDAGLEYHFGGHRRNYWPWNPNPIH